MNEEILLKIKAARDKLHLIECDLEFLNAMLLSIENKIKGIDLTGERTEYDNDSN